jgi:hypothetical protein
VGVASEDSATQPDSGKVQVIKAGALGNGLTSAHDQILTEP